MATPTVLKVAENRRYLEDDGKPVVLFGSGLWTIIPEASVDIADHNSWYSSYGINANRATLFAFCSIVDEGEGFSPWSRTGPGEALDGKPKFDLTKFDERFWKRAHEYFQDSASRGIYVLLQMFDDPFTKVSDYGGFPRWHFHPFNADNNINNIPGMPGGEGPGTAPFYDPDNKPLMEFQDALIKRLLDETVKRYGHIIYEIGNEINWRNEVPRAVQWQAHWIKFFREYCQASGVKRLLSADVHAELLEAGDQDWDIINHHGTLGYNVKKTDLEKLPDIIHRRVNEDFARFNRPIVNSRPCSDPDRVNYPDIVTEEKGRVLYWSYFTSGGHIVGFRTTRESWKDGLAAERIVGNLRKFIDETQFHQCQPHRELILSGKALCLANLGKEYVVYLPEGGSVKVSLKDVPPGTRLSARQYDPRTAEFQSLKDVDAKEAEFTLPSSGVAQDWALHLAPS
jgi:hypothetical protein